MKTLEQVYKLLREGKDELGLSILNQSLQASIADSITAQLLIIQLGLATRKGREACNKLSDLEYIFNNPNIVTLPKHALLRYLRIKFFLKDLSLPEFILNCCERLGAELPLWADYYFEINHKMRAPELLDFDSFYFLPIPKNASSTIGSRWCSSVLKEETLNPHRFYPNPFFKTVDTQRYSATNDKPVVCILRKEEDRIDSYFRGNIAKYNSLAKGPEVDRFMGLKVKPSREEFYSDIDLYKLVFDDAMHHLLPSDAYLKPFGELKPLVIDFSMLNQLEELYPNIFPLGYFSKKRLMIG